MTSVLLTGSTGFVGRALALQISRNSHFLLSVALRAPREDVRIARQFVTGDLSATTDWSSAVAGQQIVVHAAARVHVINDDADHPLSVFRAVNVDGTLNLARQAARAGVRRFVFVSSIKVNGERTAVSVPFKPNDSPCPEDPYAISKHEAEVGLRQIAEETGMEVVIVRPPLVYGPKVKGNFATMLRWVQHGIPLPLGAVTENRRSLVALDNLVDLLVVCMDHPAAANETFLVSDGEDLSTTDLLYRLGNVINKRARLLAVPPYFVQLGAKLLGKGDMVQRLLGSLQVDISYTCQKLEWEPPVCTDEGLRRTVEGLNK